MATCKNRAFEALITTKLTPEIWAAFCGHEALKILNARLGRTNVIKRGPNLTGPTFQFEAPLVRTHVDAQNAQKNKRSKFRTLKKLNAQKFERWKN